MDTWDFFYLLTNRNQRKPFSAPNCSKKQKKKNWRWKRIISKKKKKKKSGGDDVEDRGQRRRGEGGRIDGKMTSRDRRSSFVLTDAASGDL